MHRPSFVAVAVRLAVSVRALNVLKVILDSSADHKSALAAAGACGVDSTGSGDKLPRPVLVEQHMYQPSVTATNGGSSDHLIQLLTSHDWPPPPPPPPPLASSDRVYRSERVELVYELCCNQRSCESLKLLLLPKSEGGAIDLSITSDDLNGLAGPLRPSSADQSLAAPLSRITYARSGVEPCATKQVGPKWSPVGLPLTHDNRDIPILIRSLSTENGCVNQHLMRNFRLLYRFGADPDRAAPIPEHPNPQPPTELKHVTATQSARDNLPSFYLTPLEYLTRKEEAVHTRYRRTRKAHSSDARYTSPELELIETIIMDGRGGLVPRWRPVGDTGHDFDDLCRAATHIPTTTTTTTTDSTAASASAASPLPFTAWFPPPPNQFVEMCGFLNATAPIREVIRKAAKARHNKWRDLIEPVLLDVLPRDLIRLIISLFLPAIAVSRPGRSVSAPEYEKWLLRHFPDPDNENRAYRGLDTDTIF